MKAISKTTSEYAAFEGLLRRIVKVPHSEIKSKLEAEKRTKTKKRAKTSPASRASNESD